MKKIVTVRKKLKISVKDMVWKNKFETQIVLIYKEILNVNFTKIAKIICFLTKNVWMMTLSKDYLGELMCLHND